MKYKKLSIVFLIILFLLCFTVVSFGATADYNSEHYVEIIRNNTIVIRICADEDFYMVPTDGSTSYWSTYSISTGELICCTVYKDGNVLYDNVDSKILTNQFTNGSDEVNSYSGNVILYKDSTKTDTFFHQAPRLVPIMIQERGALETILLQIVKILPMILVVVVSFLGLRKCWRLLSMLLHQA